MRNIKFQILLTISLMSTFLFVSASYAAITCNPCDVGNCQCSITDFSSGNLGIYTTSDCSGFPKYYKPFSGGIATWSPTQAGTYYLRAFSGSSNSACAAQQVPGGPTSTTISSSTTTTITTTTVPANCDYRIEFNAGWNMFSIPVNKVVQTSELFATMAADTTDGEKICTTNDVASKIWHYLDGKYASTSSIEPGLGYWVKMRDNCVVCVTGEPVTIDYFPKLSSGWNQVGGPTESVEFSTSVGDCTVTGGPWNYNTLTKQYERSTYLDAGKGYWIRVDSGCLLGMEQPPAPPTIGSIFGNILGRLFPR